ncbi:N-acetylmuramoyl-L-alanine amidase [Bacillus oleivorans]|uniref:N-acetylmuramoyl-L-alanine amidase n=1 Tax=Bacillus oleivorans TaxID=1448271 RepID=A0A285D6N6_9BACI|nr:N-acetylmuramoyl-L-alanine amidase [Bacillus oleivorans]
MNIIQDLIPGYKAYSMTPKYITVHTTRNLSKGANARMHSKYLKGTDTTQKSWHLTVDDKEVIQHIPFDVNGWHAGDGQGKGNRQSIGIEICENEDGDFDKAVENAIELIRYLMNKFNISIENVVPHKHWSGKYCPVRLLPKWNEFIKKIEGKKVAKQVSAFNPSSQTVKQETKELLHQLYKNGVLSADWSARIDELTDSDVIGLLVTAINRKKLLP